MKRISVAFSDAEWERIEAFRQRATVKPSVSATIRHLTLEAISIYESRLRAREQRNSAPGHRERED